MFSFAKKPAAQEVVLQDLTENQLTQVAGGACKDNDDKKHVGHKSHSSESSHSSKSTHHHHHHHHHHYHTDNDK